MPCLLSSKNEDGYEGTLTAQALELCIITTITLRRGNLILHYCLHISNTCTATRVLLFCSFSVSHVKTLLMEMLPVDCGKMYVQGNTEEHLANAVDKLRIPCYECFLFSFGFHCIEVLFPFLCLPPK